jgi:hypothetical protein
MEDLSVLKKEIPRREKQVAAHEEAIPMKQEIR